VLFLCLDFCSVPETDDDVVLAVHGHVVDHREPVIATEFSQKLLLAECLKKGADLVVLCLQLCYLIGDFAVLVFGSFVTPDEGITAALVVVLILSGILCICIGGANYRKIPFNEHHTFQRLRNRRNRRAGFEGRADK